MLLLILMLNTVALEPINEFPRQLHDNSGNSIVIKTKPQRIVSLTLATDEILLAICPPKQIAAISTMATDSTYSNVVMQAKGINTTTTNTEHILGFKPDLVFVASYTNAEMIQLLKQTNSNVFKFTNFNNIAAIKQNIKTVGFAIGAEQQANNIVKKMEVEIKAIQAKIPKSKSPRIISYSLGNYIAGHNTTFDDMAKLVGAINIAAKQGIEQHAKINNEYILAWQPEFIISHAHKDRFAIAKQQMLANPAIAASNAKIIIIDNRYFLSVSQYIVHGIKALAKGLYDM